MAFADGTIAPDFTLLNADGQPFTLSQASDERPILLFFYPRDFTTICTQQACKMRDGYKFFLDLGVRVVGVSVDDQDSHQKFKRQYRLPFELLSDPGRKVARMYKAVYPIINRTHRISYLLGHDLRILTSFKDEWSPDAHLSHMVNYAVVNELHQRWPANT